jgi:hypothetical protein
MRRWQPGTVIVVQEVWKGRLWAARPVVVVDDSHDQLVLWSPRGTRRKVPVTPATRLEAPTRGEQHADSLASLDWEFGDSIWDVSTLWLLQEGDWHAVWVSFLETGEQLGWYINFQEPFRRTAEGIQMMDLALDIIAQPDRSRWRWKDQDEFELFRQRGLIDPATAERILSEANSVIERIEQDTPPFNSAWPDWRPDSSWGIPELPDNWKTLAA